MTTPFGWMDAPRLPDSQTQLDYVSSICTIWHSASNPHTAPSPVIHHTQQAACKVLIASWQQLTSIMYPCGDCHDEMTAVDSDRPRSSYTSPKSVV